MAKGVSSKKQLVDAIHEAIGWTVELDLDSFAAPWGLFRLPDESNDAFKARILYAITHSPGAGNLQVQFQEVSTTFYLNKPVAVKLQIVVYGVGEFDIVIHEHLPAHGTKERLRFEQFIIDAVSQTLGAYIHSPSTPGVKDHMYEDVQHIVYNALEHIKSSPPLDHMVFYNDGTYVTQIVEPENPGWPVQFSYPEKKLWIKDAMTVPGADVVALQKMDAQLDLLIKAGHKSVWEQTQDELKAAQKAMYEHDKAEAIKFANEKQAEWKAKNPAVFAFTKYEVSKSLIAPGGFVKTLDGKLIKAFPKKQIAAIHKVGMSDPRYDMFAEEYGFTSAEVRAIFHANDDGCTFMQIMEVIEKVGVPLTNEDTPYRRDMEAQLVRALKGLRPYNK